MTRRTILTACLLPALALTALACSMKEPIQGQKSSGLDRKLSTFAFIEEGSLATFIVDTNATRYREKDAYIPIQIAVANNGLRQLILTREGFTLIDETGKRYPAAGPRELLEGYEHLDVDQQNLAELEEIVFNKFGAYTRYGSKFSPSHQTVAFRENLVRDLVSLPKFGYIIDFLYFPQPETGLKGHKFELFLESPDLPEPIFVKFMVQ